MKKKRGGGQSQRIRQKLPLNTLPTSFNCTEELRIPTLASRQLKAMAKSIEIRQSQPVKKPTSRKSTSKSVRQNPTAHYHPPKLKTIMRQFKELKLIHERERSKSRSPASCKSRSSKKFLKKHSNPALRTNLTLRTHPTLTQKLERTLKQLNQGDFFNQDSLLPNSSATDSYQALVKQQSVSVDQQDGINFEEVREYETAAGGRNSRGIALRDFDYFKQNSAALKIQRAWKRYQTKRLVERWVFLSKETQPSPIEIEGGLLPSDESRRSEKEVIVPSEQFYESSEGERIRHVSNLEEEGNQPDECEDLMRRMKQEELQKWNQIICIISQSRSSSPAHLERLLQELAQKSELNKKDLEEKTSQHKKGKEICTLSLEREDPLPISQSLFQRHNCSSSASSQDIEEYDSRKYIQRLDGDVFPEQSEPLGRISKRKQELLLQELTNRNMPIKLGKTALYHSESLKGLRMTHRRTRSATREQLKSSNSEKILRSTLQGLQTMDLFADQGEEINLQLLTQEFLEGSDPTSENLDMLYGEERLKSKLAEVKRLKQQNHLSGYDDIDEDENQEQMRCQLIRSGPEGAHQLSVRNQIKIEDSPPKLDRMEVLQVEEEIATSSDGEDSSRVDAIAELLLSGLLVEVLKDIALSPQVTQGFKAYSLSLKPRIRKGEGQKKKKKGFPTSKAEIELFLDGIIKYLKKEEPTVFQNLQVATGPSALQMLRYMHQAGEEEVEAESEEDESNVMVIPNRIFDAFWQLKERSIVIEVPQNFDESNSLFRHQFELLKSFNKIFYRSLFDTLNECLDWQRNFGQYGRPFPWKTAPNFYHKKTSSDLQNQVQKARKRMVDYSTTYCGLIIEKQEMASLNEEYIQQVHEDRLSRMLAADLIEGEQRWMFYDDEQTEILVQIGNVLYTELLIEVMEELCQT